MFILMLPRGTETPGQWTVDSGYSSNRNYKTPLPALWTLVQVYQMQHILLFLSLACFVFSSFCGFCLWLAAQQLCERVGPFSVSLSLSLSLLVGVGSQEVTSPPVVVGEKVANRIEKLLLTRFDCDFLSGPKKSFSLQFNLSSRT